MNIFIKKIKDKFVELLFKENPIFETLLVKERKTSTKLLSKLKNTKKIINKAEK